MHANTSCKDLRNICMMKRTCMHTHVSGSQNLSVLTMECSGNRSATAKSHPKGELNIHKCTWYFWRVAISISAMYFLHYEGSTLLLSQKISQICIFYIQHKHGIICSLIPKVMNFFWYSSFPLEEGENLVSITYIP